VTVNDIHDVPQGERIYVESIQSSYRTILFTTAIITFFLTFFLSNIPVIGNRKKWNQKMNEEKLKSANSEIKEKKELDVCINNDNNGNDTPIYASVYSIQRNSVTLSDSCTIKTEYDSESQLYSTV